MGVSNEELNQKIQDLLTRSFRLNDEAIARENGTATGGPNGDGYYPYTDSAGVTNLRPSPARMALDAATPKLVELTGPGPFSLTLAQAGNRVRIGNGSTAAAIVVNIPVAPLGTVWFIRQRASAPLKFIPPTGVLLRNRLGLNGTAGQYASVAICYEASDQIFLDGDAALVA